MTRRLIIIMFLIAVAAITNALTVNFFVDGRCVKSKEYIANALILRSDLPDATLHADSVEFIGWTDVPFDDVTSESKVKYYDFNSKLTANINIYAVYAVKSWGESGFSLVTSKDEIVAGDLYLFADFAAEDAEEKHLMSVNQQGHFGFLPSASEVVYENGRLVPSEDVFVARLNDIAVSGRCRFAQYGTDRVLALNDGSVSSTFRYVGCANPMPLLGTSNAGLLSYFNINVAADAQTRMWVDEKNTAHFAMASLSRNGYTYKVFHNTALSAPLYLYRQHRVISRVTRFASQPPVTDAINETQDFDVRLTADGLKVSVSGTRQLTITDMSGRVIISQTLGGGEHVVRLGGLHGVYILRLGGHVLKFVL